MLDPTLAALQTALGAKPGGVVPFNQATLGDPGAGIISIFDSALGTDEVVLEGDATITADDDKDLLYVIGTGTTTLAGVPTPGLSATFSTTPDPDHGGQLLLQLELVIATGSGWSLADTFPMLGGTVYSKLVFATGDDAPRLVLRSLDGEADAFGVTEPAGLNLEATVDVAASSPLAGAVTLVPSLANATVALAGPVATSATAESLRVHGAVPDTTATVPISATGLAAVSMKGLALAVTGNGTKDDAGDVVTGLAVEVWGMVALAGNQVPFSMSVPFSSGSWTLGLLPGDPATLTELLALLVGVPLLAVVPDAVKNAVNLPVSTLSVTLTTDRSAYVGVSVVVGSTEANTLNWSIVPGVVELTSLGVGLEVATQAGGSRVTSGYVSGTLALDGGVSIGALVTIPLGTGPITVTAYPNLTLADLGPLSRFVGGGGLAALLPDGAGTIAEGFELSMISVTIDPSGQLLSDAAFEIRSVGPWTVLPGQLVIESLVLDVDVASPLSSPSLTGKLQGTFAIGETNVTVAVQRLGAGLPWELLVHATDVPLPTISTLAELAGSDIGADLPPSLSTLSLAISDLELDVNLSKPAMEQFAVTVANTQPWVLVPTYLQFNVLSLGVALDWRSGALSVTGTVLAELEVADTVTVLGSATRQASGAWVLSASLDTSEHPVTVGDLATRFFPSTTIPAEIAGLGISALAFTTDTGDGTYTFDAGLTWPFEIGGVSFTVAASVTVARAALPGNTYGYSGTIEGDLSSHFGSNQLELKVVYQFQTAAAAVLSFTIGFNGIALNCTSTTNAAGDSILTAKLTGLSFGDVVTFLVNLVDPSLHFSLSSPWDVLNQVRFDDFSLVANLTQRTVGVRYDANQNLGIVDIGAITLTYLSKGGTGTVDIAITGSFVGQTYTDDKPLTWDLLNSSPPAVPGKGPAFFDLQYVGLGQHLVLVDPAATDMPTVLSDLSKTVTATTDSSQQPWDLLKFDPSAGWLVGAQFTVMGTVTIGFVFDDPVLFGVEISMGGPKAGIFAGLDFQILYRKVTDTIGVYHIELKLPDAMRHLEFGEVSVTLPIVVLDIYTNGDFSIDLGFPYNNDWTVSFGLQVFPFVGAGGFYFAKLSGATATDIPQITNGTFDPVIEFGLALAVGVGKEISEGPFSAGLSLTVQGVLQGVVAWFNPNDTSAASDRYYRVKGSIAIVGKLYGKVDFKILTIDVSVVAYASATLVVEAYQPIYIELSVGVTVSASIKVLFIRIHFSFSMHLDASFTIGSASTPPWTVAPGGAPATRSLVERRRRLPSLGPAAVPHRRLALAAAAPALDWSPVNVLGSVVPVLVDVVPVFTVSGGPALTGEVVMATFARTTAPTEAVTAAELRAAAPRVSDDGSPLPFDVLVEAFIRWGAHALLGRSDGPVTLVDLSAVYDDLCTDATAEGGFGYDNLSEFLGANVVLMMAGPGDGSGDEQAGSVVPIPPPLAMAFGNSSVDFSTFTPVAEDYLETIADLFAAMSVPYGAGTATDPAAPPAAETGAGASSPSLPIAVFADSLLLLARTAVQNASDALSSFSWTAGPSDSLASLAATYSPTVGYAVRDGDTVTAIAAMFGVSVEDVVAANPTVDFGAPLVTGTALEVPPPVTEARYVVLPADVAGGGALAAVATKFHVAEADVAASNPGVDFSTIPAGTAVHVPVPSMVFAAADANLTVTLAGSVHLVLGGVTYQTRAGDTLTAVADRFGVDDVAALVAQNADDAAVLQTSSTLTVASADGTSFPYVVAADDTLDRIAAYFYVRGHDATAEPYFGWFASAITAGNPTVDFSTIGTTAVELTVPSVTVSDHGLVPGTPTTYTTKAGDTLDRVAGYFTVLETDPGVLADLEQAISGANESIDPGQTIQVPPIAHTVLDGETFSSIAAAFGPSTADLAGANAGAAVLATNATLTLPPSVPYTTTGTETLPSLASALGLTVDELVGQVAPTPGLFAGAITLPNARQADLDDLIALVTSSGASAQVASVVSRFLLHGLRLPDPAGTSATFAMYALSGQQFAAPSPMPSTYPVTFTAPSPVPWVAFTETYVTQQDDTLQTLLDTFHLANATELELLNPDVDFSDLQLGTTVYIPLPELVVDIAPLASEAPATTLDPELLLHPQPLPLGQPTPVQYAMTGTAAWQAAVVPALPTTGTPPQGGRPSLWSLPATLLNRAAASSVAPPFQLYAGVPTSNGLQPDEVTTYAWGTSLPFTVERVPSGAGFLPNTYLVVGVPQTGRDALLELWTHLASSGDTVALSLLYQAPAAAGSQAGFVSDDLDPAATAILKTNLSTETHSGETGFQAMADVEVAPSGPSYATIAAGQEFLQLLWECSIVGSGGFYLTYATPQGAGLSDAVFSAGTEAQLQLVALLGRQTASTPDRGLYPFTNTAVVLDNLDPSRVTVYAQAAGGTETTVVATVPPGSVGFELSRQNASFESDSAEQRTRSLASLVGFTLTGATGDFSVAAGLPIGPLETSTPTGLPAPVAGNDDPTIWYYQQVVPVSRFATVPAPSLAPGLPPATANPYAGLGGTATFSLTFRDVFGNDVAPETPLEGVSAPVKYTDPLLGLAAWPGVTASYEVVTVGSAPTLTIDVSLGLPRYVPDASTTHLAAARAAAADQVTYGSASYQLHQPDVSWSVATSMDPPGKVLASGPAVGRPLAAFADATYLYLAVAATVQPVEHQVAGTSESFSTMSGTYGVAVAALGTANADADAYELFAGPLVVPVYHVVAAGESLDDMAAAAGIDLVTLLGQNADVALAPGVVLPTGATTYTTVAGDTLAGIALLEGTTPADLGTANSATANVLNPAVQVTAGGVTVPVGGSDTFDTLVTKFAAEGVTVTPATLATANAQLADLFLTGVAITVAQVPVLPTDTTGVRSATVPAGGTLGGSAATLRCTAVGLATANGQTTGLLTGGQQVVVRGITVDVDANDTFVGLVAKLAAQGVTVGVADVAAADGADALALVEGAVVHVPEYAVQAGDTLSSVTAAEPQLTTAVLARFAGPGPAGAYPSGTPLYVRDDTVTPLPGDTLSTIAAANGDTVEELADANATTALRQHALVDVPGAVTVDPDLTAGHGGYRAAPGDTIQAIATKLGLTVDDLATLDATMPGLFVAGVTIDYPDHPVTTSGTSTLTSLAAAAGGVPVTTFAADPSVKDATGLVAEGALFVTTLPLAGSRTLGDLGTDLGIDLASLAQANAAVVGLLQPNGTFTVGTATVTATAEDTLQSIAYRFGADHGVTVDVAGLATANAGVAGLLVPTAPVILPPSAAELSLPMTDVVVPAPVFPLAVSLTLERTDSTLVDPEFAGVAGMLSATMAVAPLLAPATEGAVPSLVPFATAFESALEDRRLKVATGPDPSTGERQVWVVSFGAEGFSTVQVDGAATRYFALAPLSRELSSATGVPIKPYDPATGTLGTAVPKSFSSVDVDLWMSSLLGAVDLVLSPSYATGVFPLAGHADLDAIVNAKGAIAAALQDRVLEVLGTDQPPDDDPGLVAARQALYQSMLVTLSTAYTTDAVVQVPVKVASPYGAPYVVQAGDGFAQLAAHYQVSPAGAAVGLADVTGLVAQGVAVSFSGRDYTTVAGDTLAGVATALGTTADQLPAGMTVQGGAELFVTGAAVDRVTMHRTPAATDSFATLATYFSTDAGTVGLDNETVAGVIVEGTVVTVGGNSHTVGQGETLSAVAAAVGVTAAQLAADPSVVGRAGILETSAPLFAFSDRDPIAPRASGQAAPDLPRLAATTTFAGLLTYYGVSDEFLGEYLGAVVGILAVGASLAFGAQPAVTVQAGDTPSTLASHFGVDVATFLSGVVVASGSLFAPGAVVPLGRVTRQPAATDTFQSLAAFFQTTVADVAVANEDVPGIFVPGTVITIGATSHQVTAGEKLTAVATAFGLSPAAFAVAPGIAGLQPLFDPSTTLYGLQPTPALSLSTAKTALTDGGSLATFLFSTGADASYRSLFLDLEYPFDELEFQVQDVPEAGSYQSSEWLKLLVPLASSAFGGAVDTEVGEVDVPIPLRTFPFLPDLTSQSAEAVTPDATTVGDAKEWALRTTFSHQSAAQDTIYLEVAYGGAAELMADAVDPLFAALAQFASVWPALEVSLAQLPSPSPGTTTEFLTNVTGTFATLVSAVATALSPGGTFLAFAADGDSFEYRLGVTYDYTQGATPMLESLVLTLLPPSDPADVPWPDVYVPPDAGAPLAADDPDGPVRVYHYPPGVAAFAPLDQCFVFPGAGATAANDAALRQQGSVTIVVTRNESLVASLPTQSQFVYQTPDVTAQNPAVPALVDTTAIDLGAPGAGGDVTAPVTALLDALFATRGGAAPPASLTFRLGCRYGQPLTSGPGPVVSFLPIVYAPLVTVEQNGVGAFATAFSAQVQEWHGLVSPRDEAGDFYAFDLSLYGDAMAVSRPLVSLTCLTSTLG